MILETSSKTYGVTGSSSLINLLVVKTRWFSVIPHALNSSIAGLLSSYSEISFISIFSFPSPNIPAVPIVFAPFLRACLIIFDAVGIVSPPAITIITTSPLIKSKLSSSMYSGWLSTFLKSSLWVHRRFKKSGLFSPFSAPSSLKITSPPSIFCPSNAPIIFGQ